MCNFTVWARQMDGHLRAFHGRCPEPRGIKRKRGEEPNKMTGKKEQEEARKQKAAKAGSRLRKAGAKHNKFDAEAAGKKANKKNGLIH